MIAPFSVQVRENSERAGIRNKAFGIPVSERVTVI